MSLDEFFRILSEVYLSKYEHPPHNLTYERNITIRFLDSLGHCEFDFDNRKVHVCSPLLVLLPTCGLPRAILTGARSPSLLKKLKQAVRKESESTRFIRQQHKKYRIIPEAIIIETTDLGLISEIARSSKISYNDAVSAWEIVNFASGIQEIRKKSDFRKRDELNWKHRIFSPKQMRFITQSENNDEVRLVEYTNPVTQQRRHWLWKGNLATKVDRDWGRYIVLANYRVRILVYDEIRNRLCVPEYIPLPRFFSRALTLCSGMVPLRCKISAHNEYGFPPNLPVNLYSEAPPEIVNILSKKISQVPIRHELEINKKGEIL
jgi:hypothetical protein